MKRLKRGCRDMQQHQEEQLGSQKGQLFSAIQRPVKNLLEEQLFQPMLKNNQVPNKYRPCRKVV